MLRTIFILLIVAGANALTLHPEITINTEQLTPEKKEELFNLQEKLESYISERDWDPEEEHLELSIPLAIQFTSAAESGGGWEYTALFATGNKHDISIDESSWRFKIPGGNLDYSEDLHDSFLAMINYHVYLIIGHEYDKLGEFAGEESFQRARRIGIMATLDERSDGWDRRKIKLEEFLDPRAQEYRTLRWVTHTAFWFRTVMKNDYEAWITVRLALDIIEDLDDPRLLAGYFKANHRSLVEILIRGKDQDALFLLMRLDSLDPLRTEYYQEQLLRVAG